MMQQLNKAMPEENKRRFGFLWWLVPALLLTGGVSSYYLFKKQPDEIAIISTKAIAPAIQLSAPVARPDASSTVLPNNYSKNSTYPTQSPSVSETIIPVAIKSKKTIQEEAVQKQQTNVAVAMLKENNTVITAAQETEGAPPAPAATAKETSEQNQLAIQPIVQKQDSSFAKEPGQEAATIKITKRKTSKEWSIAIMGGVDESTVKLRYAYDPGYNIGIMTGYHFSKKLSIHTGAIYTQKNYKIAGADFTAPKGSWLSYINLQTVEGYCRMWEVPLLLRYTLSSTDKKSFFLSTGLSSYFMSVENYEYAYLYNGQPMVRNSNYNSSDTRILSIAHLSAGFENRIGKQLFLLVEPYAKIPLGGIGLGNIKLSSFGINFSIQRRQPFRK
jgi:hypothetical protein